jgi:hypothetical protein
LEIFDQVGGFGGRSLATTKWRTMLIERLLSFAIPFLHQPAIKHHAQNRKSFAIRRGCCIYDRLLDEELKNFLSRVNVLENQAVQLGVQQTAGNKNSENSVPAILRFRSVYNALVDFVIRTPPFVVLARIAGPPEPRSTLISFGNRPRSVSGTFIGKSDRTLPLTVLVSKRAE